MYAIYQYKAGSTTTNILNDVVAILTNETNTANLSASAEVSGCSILTSETSAGWTTYDVSAGTNFKVLSAPWHVENGSGNNYIGIDTNTAGYIHVRVFENWNAGTHVGTNECANSTSTLHSQRLNIAAGGFLHISAQEGHSCILFSYQSSVFGNSTALSPSGMVERTRKSPWDTNANLYPVATWLSCATNAFFGSVGSIPRVVNGSGVDSTAGSSIVYSYTSLIGTYNSSNFTLAFTTTIPNENKILQHLFVPIYVNYASYGFFGGNISKYSNFWNTTQSYGSAFDEVVNNSKTYIIWTSQGNFRYAVRKG